MSGEDRVRLERFEWDEPGQLRIVDLGDKAKPLFPEAAKSVNNRDGKRTRLLKGVLDTLKG